ncbi:MAG: hypothetical protein KGN84_14020 [Acidobacteriota bacterium]|nr:hypothetical protein [Acidobacteriota bacterium]
MSRARLLFALFLLATPLAHADEAADGAAIEALIRSLNQIPRPQGLFLPDAYSELNRLPSVPPVSFRTVVVLPLDGTPHVRISTAVWGEAEIDYPAPRTAIESLDPRIAGRAIRIATPNLAWAEAAWTSDNRTIPLLLVFHKQNNGWKIASLRVMN